MAEELHSRIEAFRRFNRFYTRQIGLLNQGLLKTRYPLTQARILFELAHHEETTASNLIEELNIDPGYISRILSAFEEAKLVRRARSREDSRHRLLKLTTKGKRAFSVLNSRSSREASSILEQLPAEEQERLLNAMQTIERVLQPEKESASSFILRSYHPGDIGWITYRHGVLYAEEYGFDETFEALVAEILANFVKHHNPKKERLWIAEQDGERVGSVMLVDAGKNVSQLRILLLEPRVRGKGLGKKLVEECIQFSKRAGYRKIKLWTQSILNEARGLYSKFGFELVAEKRHHSFGHDLIAEIWELRL